MVQMRCVKVTKRWVLGWILLLTGAMLLASLLHTGDYTGVYEFTDSFWGPGESNWNMTAPLSKRLNNSSYSDYRAADDPVILLIMAYMHTGSSYTGRIFQQHPGTYYEYEPLRSLQGDSRKGATIYYRNGTFRRLHGLYIDRDVATEAINHMITCQHEKLDLSTLSKSMFHPKSVPMRSKARYFDCVQRYRRSETTPRWDIVMNCLSLLKTTCQKASIRAFKFIRMRADTAAQILEGNRLVKIIHLVRDPRAMLNSQVRKNSLNSRDPREFEINAENFCTRTLFNLEIQEKLKLQYPGRIVTLRYEDLVEQPIAKARELFEFINVPFVEEDEKFIREASIDAVKNSTIRANVWRRSITAKQLSTVNKHCSDVYKRLGYVEFSNLEEIHNVARPTYISQDQLSGVK